MIYDLCWSNSKIFQSSLFLSSISSPSTALRVLLRTIIWVELAFTTIFPLLASSHLSSVKCASPFLSSCFLSSSFLLFLLSSTLHPFPSFFHLSSPPLSYFIFYFACLSDFLLFTSFVLIMHIFFFCSPLL